MKHRQDRKKQALLHALDITIWRQRTMAEVEVGLSPALCCDQKNTGLESNQTGQVQDLPLLAQFVSHCQLCPLHQTRTQTVFGTGNTKAKLMLIGEAPGLDEDQQGEPFLGRAGQLLTAMLTAIGLERSDVYITNILKCRPSNNRDPLPAEIAQCLPYLQQQIALIQPKILCALGKIAAQVLLKDNSALGELRRQWHTYGTEKLPLLVTYHPAYLLRHPSAKAQAYQDLQLLQRFL